MSDVKHGEPIQSKPSSLITQGEKNWKIVNVSCIILVMPIMTVNQTTINKTYFSPRAKTQNSKDPTTIQLETYTSIDLEDVSSQETLQAAPSRSKVVPSLWDKYFDAKNFMCEHFNFLNDIKMAIWLGVE